MSAWFAAFVWTLAIEGLVLELALGRFAKRPLEALVWCLCLNLATHPLFSWWVLGCNPSSSAIAGAEVVIALVEGLALGFALRARTGFVRPALAAALANAVSYAFGVCVLAPLSA